MKAGFQKQDIKACIHHRNLVSDLNLFEFEFISMAQNGDHKVKTEKQKTKQKHMKGSTL